MPFPQTFFESISTALADLDYVPLLLAFISGGAIGFERELSGRAAGLRTHILVCICSTMLILVSRSAADTGAELDGIARVVFDPNRMGAGIVTGIGFLGAACVMRSGDALRGLTTGACIWFVAGLGIVIGSGQYALALAGTFLVLVVLTLVNRFANMLSPRVYRRLIVITTSTQLQAQADDIRAVLKRHEMSLLDLASGHSAESGRNELVFYVALKNNFQAPQVTEEVGGFRGVLSARWKQSEH